jgi:tetratricopeptide (TPR) repeat protein
MEWIAGMQTAIALLSAMYFIAPQVDPSLAAGAFDDVLAQAELALRQRKFREAADLATKAIEQMPDIPNAYLLRAIANRNLGRTRESITDLTKAIELKPEALLYVQRSSVLSELDEYDKAIADIDSALKLAPKLRGAYRQRGREQFKRGDIAASLADFDRFVTLEPEHELDLWERGLTRYYARQFALAQRSFEDYHKFGPTDIENGLWRMISQAEVEGVDKARRDLFKYEPKTRPPFPALYELYSGNLLADDVLQHATDGAADATDRRTRTFYAHLYVGLWYTMNRDTPQAIEQLEKAVALKSTDYMWYVARFHLQQLKKPPTGLQPVEPRAR